jgi:Na+/proline symporter
MMRVAGILTIIVGIVQIAIAVVLRNADSSALNMALAVASLINGPILGVFLVGAFLHRAREMHALIGMLVSIVLMTYILLASNKFVAGPVIAWPWYALIGSLTTLIVTFAASIVISNKDEVLE